MKRNVRLNGRACTVHQKLARHAPYYNGVSTASPRTVLCPLRVTSLIFSSCATTMIHGEHYEGLTQTRVYSVHRETCYNQGRLSGGRERKNRGSERERILECMPSPPIYTVFAALILHTPSVQARLVNVYR